MAGAETQEDNAKNSFGAYTGFRAFASTRGAVVTEEDAGKLGAGVVREFFKLCGNRP